MPSCEIKLSPAVSIAVTLSEGGRRRLHMKFGRAAAETLRCYSLPEKCRDVGIRRQNFIRAPRHCVAIYSSVNICSQQHVPANRI